MNSTLTLEPPISTYSSRKNNGLYQQLVLDALSKMTVGSLRLELPDGSVRLIGVSGQVSGGDAMIRVIKPSFFKRCLLFGDIGFGESYVAGEWETDSIERVITWAILNIKNSPTMSGSRTVNLALNLLKGYNLFLHWLRPNSITSVRRNIAEHYDLGNDFYRLWLDPSMTYSSARFTPKEQTLEQAQTGKYEAICRKLQLHAHDRVLEIGGGWGGFASHAVRTRGCRVKAVTISQAQFDFASRRFEQEGISDRATVELCDYRHIIGKYDKIVSIEMMEALGDQYLETFCGKLDQLLVENGLVALQYITVPDCRHRALKRGVDWIQKHIFPGSLLLSVGRVNQAFNRTSDLFPYDLEDLGPSYARTLHAWWETFNSRLPEIRKLGFDDLFIRKWNYYLQYCEAAFANRNISVVQAIYTRPNNRGLKAVY